MKQLFVLVFGFSILSAEIITPIKEASNFDVNKVNLGRVLFFDEKLSTTGTISCVSCHNDFGSDKRDVSLNAKGEKGSIQSITVFNAVNNYKQLWNGRATTLAEQIDGIVFSKYNNDFTLESIEKGINTKEYKEAFKKVYNKEPSYELYRDAVVAFEETLTTPNGKFDRYLQGKYELTNSEKKGFELFKNYGCAVCHNGVNVGGNSMQKIGTIIPYPFKEGQKDLYYITKDEADKNVFKVPSLRNVSKTAPYFHDASAKTLSQAIKKMAYHNLGIVFSDTDIEYIIEFLKTLDGDVPKTWGEENAK